MCIRDRSYDLDEIAEHCLGDHGSILIAGEFRKPTPDKLLLGYCTMLLLSLIHISSNCNHGSS